MSTDADEGSGPFESPLVAPFLTGVYLAVNGLSDAYLVVDGPNCVFFRISQVQGNHDWHADLARVSGLHRIVDTDATPTRVSGGDPSYVLDRLRRVDALPDCGAILMTAMASVAITGRQYDVLVSSLDPPLSHPVIHVPEGSLSGSWVLGYARVLEALARELPLGPPERCGADGTRGASGAPSRVAVVGHLYHRNEGDARADLAEIRRLVEGLGLQVVSLWPDGGPVAGLQAAGTADLVLSLPYGRRAGAILAERLGVPCVEAPLPVGLDATGRMLTGLALAAGRPEAAETFLSEELGRWVPRMQWALTHELLHRRVIVVGDPFLAPALRSALEELGCDVALEAIVDRRDEDSAEPGDRRFPAHMPLRASSRRQLMSAVEEARRRGPVDVAIVCSEAVEALRAGGPVLPFVEVGFPSYYTHAFFPMPLYGYEGAACLVTRVINACRHAQVAKGD